ncbi:uncharacterized protein LOC129744060 [Uranotaenia lowii]|uniref:uncharacterized protein LOC129744060 n=1 Tax=Uranotaenia lowii TaxID=190385 RepID=UPI00247AF50A|nr:uncharacterized protein LOC129744060 [Uranotaenia lowii]XP_055592373.1 uncharacterized protein LOC129744060 [Uranotaenia lowii]
MDTDGYKKTGNLGALHGGQYQLHTLMLLYERATYSERYEDMRLATEMDAAGKFDDCILSWHERKTGTKHWLFVQVKRKEMPAKLTEGKLLPLSAKERNEGDFSLYKYLLSAWNINNNEDFEGAKHLLIFTNAGLSSDLELYMEDASGEIEDCLKVNHSNARWLKFKATDEQLQLLADYASKEFDDLARNISAIMLESQTEFDEELIKKYRAALANRILVADKSFIWFAPRFVKGSKLEPLETLLRNKIFKDETYEQRTKFKVSNKNFNQILRSKDTTCVTLPKNISKEEVILFLSRLILAVGQPDNKKLQDIIKDDLGALCPSHDRAMKNYFVMLAFKSLLELVNNCLETKPGIILKKDFLKEKMVQTDELYRNSTKLNMYAAKFQAEMENLGLRFVDFDLTTTKFPLLVLTSTSGGLLTRLKYFGKLQSYPHCCYNLKDLTVQSDRNSLYSMLKNQQGEFFVLLNAYGSKLVHLDEIVGEILANPLNKLILLTNSKEPVVNLTKKFIVIEDEISHWHLLDEPSQQTLMQRTVLFQNVEVTLSDLISLDPALSSLLQGEILEHIIRDKTPFSIGPELPSLQVRHYLPRTISYSQSKDVSDYLRIPTEFDENVFLKHVGASNSSRVIVLSSAPGNGKSTLWTSLASKAKAMFPTHWVLFLKLQDCVGYVSKPFDVKDIFGVGDFEESYLQLRRENPKGRIFVFLDGFDEVPYDTVENMITFIKVLSKNAFLLINTRSHREKDLAQVFPGRELFCLNQLTRNDQKTMLADFMNVVDCKDGPLYDFMEMILDKLHGKSMESVNDFVGIPLLIEMFASIYRRSVEIYLKWGKAEMLRQNHLASLNILQLYNQFVYSSYRRKVVSQLGLEEESQHAKKLLNKNNYMYQGFLDLHNQLGLMNLIEEQKMKIFGWDEYSLNVLRQKIKLLDSAVVSKISSRSPSFIHKSIGEYFAARFLFEYLICMVPDHINISFSNNNAVTDTPSESIESLFDVYYNSLYRYPTVRKFFFTIANSAKEATLDKLISVLMYMRPHSFFWACEENCTEFVRRMIGIDPLLLKSETNTKESVLHLAAAKGNNEICVLLLKKKSSINALNQWRQTPLHKASLNGHAQTAELLLDRGAEIDCVDSKFQSAVYLAARAGYAEVVDLLARKGANLNQLGETVWNALHVAAFRGHCEVVRVLLKYDIQLNNRIEGRWIMFMGQMCSKPNSDIALLLIDHELKTDRESGIATLKWLVERDNVRLFNTAVAYLDPSNLNEFYQLAIARRSFDVARLIISLAKPFSSLENALHLAVAMGATQCVVDVIKRNPDVNMKDDKGKTPLEYALKNGYYSIVHILVSYSAVINKYDLHIAIKSGKPQSDVCVGVLLHNKADPNICDTHGQTPLHWAVIKRNLSCVQLLFQYGINPTKANAAGQTALHLAVKSKDSEMVELILQYTEKLDGFINQKDKRGNTALHEAFAVEQLDIMYVLIENGADPKCLNTKKQTPLEYAGTKIADTSKVQHYLKIILLTLEDKNPADVTIQ